jgi:hypothetical protein
VEYEDDEGDIVRVSNNDDVVEAFSIARRSGHKLAKLTATEIEVKTTSSSSSKTVIVGTVAVATVLGIAGVFLSRSKPK